MADDEAPRIDLDEVARLVDTLEQDLRRVRGGTQDIEALREEVAQLRRLLDEGAPHEPVGAGLSRLHRLMDELVDDAIEGARYVGEIGRMLGM